MFQLAVNIREHGRKADVINFANILKEVVTALCSGLHLKQPNLIDLFIYNFHDRL